MPRVKIDYVVSFSSEDPENPANNLLEWEVSKKKWLCSKGESSCSVVLQLTKAIKIESINIGAYHAASVEVLVGLSEKPNDTFQVLVPTCMLLSPTESRREEGIERVRSFSSSQLTAVRERRWDRVRLVCTQPYNKHCKYGLSFVHIHEPEGPVLSAFPRTLTLDALPSDDEEFRPGELFARHANTQRASADAQIRQASMEAIKNNSNKSTKLLKTPITKTSHNNHPRNDETAKSNRQKENLMYTDDDKQPHAKIDQVVQRHQIQKDKEKTPNNHKAGQNHDKEKSNLNRTNSSKENKTETQKRPDKNSTPQKNISKETASHSSHKKRKRSDEDARSVLAGVEFTLSGYENPLRGELRAAGLALGACYQPVWKMTCTHLVCAFPNTPKLRSARAAGSRAAAVSGEWLRACAARRRKLPWRWFALDPKEKETPPADWRRHSANADDNDRDDDTEMDTDDEIEKVLRQQEKKKRLKSPGTDDHSDKAIKMQQNDKSRDESTDQASRDETDDTNVSRESDVTFVRDERIRDNVTIDDSDGDSDSNLTDRDEQHERLEEIDTEKELPNFFEGLTFTIAEDLDAKYDRALLARYIRAYGGLVVEPAEILDARSVQYHVCGAGGGGSCAGGGGSCAAPEWVWRCHRLRALAPLHK